MSIRRLAPKELQPVNFAFTAENLAWAKKQIAKYPEGRQASAVIEILWRVQEQHDGWVSEAAIRAVADLLDMPYIRALEIATFYTMFQLQPVGKKAHVQVCGTTPCRLRGAGDIIEVCQSRIHHDPFHLSKDGNFSWEEVECLGACVNAPKVSSTCSPIANPGSLTSCSTTRTASFAISMASTTGAWRVRAAAAPGTAPRRSSKRAATGSSTR